MSITASTETLTTAISDAIASLASETDSAKQDATFRTWLTSMARFHSYSFGNQLLIAVQRPTATRVAGFNTWKNFGRSVKKGEKGIRILAPLLRKGKKEEESQNEVQNKVTRIAGFRSVCVFDVDQTEGDALPSAPQHDATEGGEDLLPKLENAVKSFGVELVYKAIQTGAQGYSKGGLIEVEIDLSIPARCGTVAHELAHELLHKVDRSQGKQQRELEAEATAFAVLSHYGIHSESRFYLASYGITGEMLTASMQTIAATTRQIIDRIDGQTKKEEREEAEAPPLPMAA